MSEQGIERIRVLNIQEEEPIMQEGDAFIAIRLTVDHSGGIYPGEYLVPEKALQAEVERSEHFAAQAAYCVHSKTVPGCAACEVRNKVLAERKRAEQAQARVHELERLLGEVGDWMRGCGFDDPPDTALGRLYTKVRRLSDSPPPDTCICVEDGYGYDSKDPLTARPCLVHSPEYREQERRVHELERERDDGAGVQRMEGPHGGPYKPVTWHEDCETADRAAIDRRNEAKAALARVSELERVLGEACSAMKQAAIGIDKGKAGGEYVEMLENEWRTLAAALSDTEEPSGGRCPTCDSDDPATCHFLWSTGHPHRGPKACCPDPFHGSPPDPSPDQLQANSKEVPDLELDKGGDADAKAHGSVLPGERPRVAGGGPEQVGSALATSHPRPLVEVAPDTYGPPPEPSSGESGTRWGRYDGFTAEEKVQEERPKGVGWFLVGTATKPPQDSGERSGGSIPRDFWREVPCGHPPDPVAAWTDDGAVCHCGRLLNAAEGIEAEGAPGPIVHCEKCGCHVAIPPAPDCQPEHPQSERCGCNPETGDVCDEHLDWRLDRCGGEPTDPGFFGRGSEHDLAGPDGYCRGCPDCDDDQSERSALESVAEEFERRAVIASDDARRQVEAGTSRNDEHVVSPEASAACWRAAANYLRRLPTQQAPALSEDDRERLLDIADMIGSPTLAAGLHANFLRRLASHRSEEGR